MLATSWLVLFGAALSTRLLVARRECLVTRGVPAPSLLSPLRAPGATLLPSLYVELHPVLPVTLWWVLVSSLGMLLTTEL